MWIVGVAVLLAAGATPQSDTVRLSESLCKSCRIELTRLAEVGDTAGPGVLGNYAIATRDPRGRFLVTHRQSPSQIAVFSPQGAFLRTVGASGAGPGEYRRIWSLTATPDGALVYDDFLKRRTFLDANFGVRLIQPAQERPDGVILRNDGSSLISAVVPTSDAIGYAVHQIDKAGARAGSKLLIRLPYREDLRDIFVRSLAPSSDTEMFWLAHRREYAFARCSQSTFDCRLFLRPTSWFPAPDPTSEQVTGTEPPKPLLMGVWEGPPSHVWVLTHVPGEKWQSGVRATKGSEYLISDINKYFDSRLELIDLKRQKVVASAVFDCWLKPIISSGIVYCHEEDSRGFIRLRILKPQIVGSL